MMKINTILWCILLSVSLWGESPPLFASVIGVAENDTLNIREKPYYRSTKVGSLPSQAYIGIEKCQILKSATWCKVYQIAQHFHEGFNRSGWVNARYLKPINRGYALIDKTRNCDYVLRCKEAKCEVVSSYETDKEYKITSIKTEWIARERLQGESHFGAMTENEDGYCTLGNWVEDYLQQKRLNELKAEDGDTTLHHVIAFTEKLRILYHEDQIIPYIHPTKGVIMTWNVLFGGSEDMKFTRKDILNMREFDKKKIHWGQTYGRGDDVWMNLYTYMEMLTRAISDITKAKHLKKLKGFKCDDSSKCKGYEIFWINENSDVKEYDYLGLVVIVEKYEDQWYVVGLLRDRWTI